MSSIVCAIRGGEASRSIQERGIELARAEKSRLIFLYIVDISGLGPLGDVMAPAIQEELAWLGKVMLQMAQRRALRAGIQAETAVRHGPVQPTIETFLRQEEAGLLLLGAPRLDAANEPDDLAFAAVAQFARAITEATGVKSEIVGRKDEG